jgi:hypothetical protein
MLECVILQIALFRLHTTGQEMAMKHFTKLSVEECGQDILIA